MAHKGRHAWVEGARGKPQGKRSGGGDTEQTAAPPHVRRTVAPHGEPEGAGPR